MKKYSIVTILTMAFLFGGIFTNSASAASNIDESQNQSNYKIYYSINNDWQTINWNQMNAFLNKYFKNWNKSSEKIEQPAPPKVEQPKQETPVVQQPKPETSTQPQDKPVAEQPAPEKPVTQVPEKEQEQQNTQTYQLNQFEQQVVELTNAERAKNGLDPLKADWELSRVARHKSMDLAKNNYFSHNSPTYGSPFDMMKAYGISYRTAGENIAKGQLNPQEVVNAWMNSPGHRANILNANFTHIGVGYVEQGNHWTQMFIGK